VKLAFGEKIIPARRPEQLAGDSRKIRSATREIYRCQTPARAAASSRDPAALPALIDPLDRASLAMKEFRKEPGVDKAG